jgi:hypothetical protein
MATAQRAVPKRGAPERGAPQHVIPVGMGREARDDHLARRAEVVPEARQLRGGDPGIDDQRAGPAVDDDRQVPEQLAPVDEDLVRDRCQQAIPTGGCSCRA